MENEATRKQPDKDQEEAKRLAEPPKKKKKEPEVTIAPSTPGGPDISVE